MFFFEKHPHVQNGHHLQNLSNWPYVIIDSNWPYVTLKRIVTYMLMLVNNSQSWVNSWKSEFLCIHCTYPTYALQRCNPQGILLAMLKTATTISGLGKCPN